MGAFVLCAAAAVFAQDATLVFYDGFGDGLGGWTATRFGIADDPVFRLEPTARGETGDGQVCELRRWFDGVEGWVLCRYDHWEIGRQEFCPDVLGLRFGAALTDTVKSFAVPGNLWPHSWPQGSSGQRLVPGCTVHRYAERGGSLAFYVPGNGRSICLDNVCLYLLSTSPRLDSTEYMRDIVVNRPDVQWGDSSFAVTYRGIPMRGRNTLLVHLAVRDTTRCWPGRYYVNDTFVSCAAEIFTDYDEISFGWRPGTDTVSVGLKGLRDSIVYSAQELTIFTLDLDTAADPRSARVRAREQVRVGSVHGRSAPGAVAVYDVQGRRVESRDTRLGRTPGVYLRAESAEGRARPVVGVGVR